MLIKTSKNKTIIKLSKKEWLKIGKQSGWIEQINIKDKKHLDDLVLKIKSNLNELYMFFYENTNYDINKTLNLLDFKINELKKLKNKNQIS